jgi:hypothetical protein
LLSSSSPISSSLEDTSSNGNNSNNNDNGVGSSNSDDLIASIGDRGVIPSAPTCTRNSAATPSTPIPAYARARDSATTPATSRARGGATVSAPTPIRDRIAPRSRSTGTGNTSGPSRARLGPVLGSISLISALRL